MLIIKLELEERGDAVDGARFAWHIASFGLGAVVGPAAAGELSTTVAPSLEHELAGGLDMAPEVRVASAELAKVYRKAAEEREKLGEFDGAVGFYTKCLESSQAAADGQPSATA